MIEHHVIAIQVSLPHQHAGVHFVVSGSVCRLYHHWISLPLMGLSIRVIRVISCIQLGSYRLHAATNSLYVITSLPSMSNWGSERSEVVHSRWCKDHIEDLQGLCPVNHHPVGIARHRWHAIGFCILRLAGIRPCLRM